MSRTFLLLQGTCTPFFSALGKALRGAGVRVKKINYTGGDALYWRAPGAINYSGTVDEAREFHERIFDSEHVTDIVLFGDRRPLHVEAIDAAEASGITVHVFEEGYFRPYWATLERGGVNARSTLPRDPDWYRKVAQWVPRFDNGEPFRSSFWPRAYHDVIYHLGNLQNPIRFPRYRSHAPVNAPTEYLAYLRRALLLPTHAKLDAQKISKLIYHHRRFWLLPLQLNSDSQIRNHSPFSDMSEVISRTIESFARFAQSSDMLIIKNHPLDAGLSDHDACIKRLAKLYEVEHRVLYIETGHLPTLLSHAQGVITVNSTVGGSALVHSRPTIALGKAIYDMPGLTFQGHLDDFWNNAEAPDAELFQGFRNVVIYGTQINGGFYSKAGIKMAVPYAVERLLARQSKLAALLDEGYVQHFARHNRSRLA